LAQKKQKYQELEIKIERYFLARYGMKGQWIGHIEQDTKQLVILNVDELENSYKGYVFILPFTDALPIASSFIETPNKNPNGSMNLVISAMNPVNGKLERWEEVKKHYDPSVTFSEIVNIRYVFTEENLTIEYGSGNGEIATLKLTKEDASKPSNIRTKELDWEGFKSEISSYLGKQYLFRGQNRPWRLQTSFHRTGRYDLLRYLSEDIHVLHRHLSSKTKHVFDLDNFKELGSFLYLAQHHGYPTPLLDWTYSPYVAAFFAFRGISKAEILTAGSNDKVRIFLFDQKLWHKRMMPIQSFLHPHLNFTVSELLAIDNDRMIPQQSVTTISNVNDIESYIALNETEDAQYIEAIDIPFSERSKVITEISYMGITAGSLFPGIDGICEDLKEKHFQ
jgi:hypothetical protein